MIDAQINAIIFDFGGVIINIDYDATIQSFKKLGIKDFDVMYSQAAQSDLFNKIETGTISEEDFISSISQFLPPGTTPNDIRNAWNAMILNVPSSSIELLRALREQGYAIYLLSNTNSIHIDAAYKEWDKVCSERPEHLFDKVYLSHQINMRKPNSDIFEFVCQDQSLDPLKTLFIDDSIQHIEGAQEIGLNTYHLQRGEKIQDVFN